ncbi:MAG: hypothetical protein HKN48_11650 [Flavobacteriaceae bacterium]|nr:hypothetical protein [Flavobacteriaceae bacterium]
MKLKMSQFLIVILSVLGVIGFSSCEEIIPPPQQSIPIEEAEELQNEFIETRAGILNDSLGFTDTRDFWFSLDTLKQYIEYVEQEAARLGKQNLGIRIYFAAYPENSEYPQPGRATVFMVPTSLEDDPTLKRGFLPIAPTNTNIDSIQALNYGHGGQPPNDI